MARSLQPRSALTPPRSPAPINATRPDFPVRAGQFLGACIPRHLPREALATLGTRTSFAVEAAMMDAVIRCVVRQSGQQ